MKKTRTKKTPLQVAEQAAFAAGKILMKSYGKLKTTQIHTKAKNDFVTEIDKKSEKLIIETIRRFYPDSSIQGEETGLSEGNSMLWIIDPLDGTANYIHQFPMFSVSIGVMEKGVLTAGVIYDPLHREMFTAEKGRGSRLNGKRIFCTRVSSLSNAMVATGIPFRARERFDEYVASFRTISMGSSGIRRGGSAALDLAYVACGRFDGFWEINLSAWDIAAGALLVQEAGGVVSDIWGKPDYLKSGDVLASNGHFHKEILNVTSSAFTKK